MVNIIIRFMEKELSYLTPEGYTIFTSRFLKNRGTCCKSACLHCPFGYTLKKCGLQFRDVTETDKETVSNIVAHSGINFDWSQYEYQNIKFILIKDVVCGVLFKNHIVIKGLCLLPQFQHQGLSKELVESYFFI